MFLLASHQAIWRLFKYGKFLTRIVLPSCTATISTGVRNCLSTYTQASAAITAPTINRLFTTPHVDFHGHIHLSDKRFITVKIPALKRKPQSEDTELTIYGVQYISIIQPKEILNTVRESAIICCVLRYLLRTPFRGATPLCEGGIDAEYSGKKMPATGEELANQKNCDFYISYWT